MPNYSAQYSTIQSTIDGYEGVSADIVRQLGFTFDPFAYLESSKDPYLLRYLLVQDIGIAATGAFHAAISAPPGGGKTALRAYAMHSCWVGACGHHSFPIVYTPPKALSAEGGVQIVTSTPYWHDLCKHTAAALLLGLSYRPERWHELADDERKLLVRLWRQFLPMERSLQILQDEADPSALIVRLEPSYRISAPPPPPVVRQFYASVRRAVRPDVPAIEPDKAFAYFVSLVRGPLGFGDVLLLVDGIDEWAKRLSDPAPIMRWLMFLLERQAFWEEQGIALKLFLPDVWGESLERMPWSFPKVQPYILQWSAARLADMLGLRYCAGSDNRICSMDAFAGPEIKGAEGYIAAQVKPYPREALLLVRRILYEFARRSSGELDEVRGQDIDAALAWYRNQARSTAPVQYA